ncbi:MAG TPA: DUF397 domain-containing protein [Acidimicrobiales bacterium]|nr:DUF397 domain-containing protein [Acidimicrobiales bacterium]
MTDEPTWHKSTLSGDQGNCVEVARLGDGTTAVRDSKHPDGAVLTFTSAEWVAFIEGAKRGEFDPVTV